MKPANIILDLLRTYGSHGTSSRQLMATGALFGHSENLMRVSLSRLVARQMIENVSRGVYRLANTTDPLNSFIERWRLGEARVKPWQQTWLLIHDSGEHAPATTAPGGVRRDWLLASHGFHRVSAGCWIRPDNLAMEHEELQQLLRQFGLADDALLASNAHISPSWCAQWCQAHEPRELNSRYAGARRALEDSLLRLPGLAHDAALRETFEVGGAAIQLLAKDPLLPAELLDITERQALWQTMLDYDQVGRRLWAEAEMPPPTALPTAGVALP